MHSGPVRCNARIPVDAAAADPPAVRRLDGKSHRIPHSRLAVAIDTASLIATLLAVLVLTNVDSMPDGIGGFLSLRITVKNIVILGFMAGVWPLVLDACGLYQRRQPGYRHAARLILASALTSWMTMLFSVTSISGRFSTASVAMFWLFSACTLFGTRAVRTLRRVLWPPQERRVIIVGMGPRGQSLFSRLQQSERKYDVVGFVDTADHLQQGGPAGRVLGSIDELELLVMHQAIDQVFITLPVASRYREIRQVLEICERGGVKTKYRADLVDTHLARPSYDDPEHSPVVTMHVAPSDSRLILKRTIDIVGASVGLITLAPLMMVIAILIKVTSGGPVLFKQDRYGLNKRVFRMWKFRTMIDGAERQQAALEDRNEMDGPVFKIRDDPRMTPLGRILRRTSLDELPQLVHVLTGQMSLVGPRPMALRDVARFLRPEDMRRFSVRPGLTCLWQVSGRNNLGFNEWVKLDLTYIDVWSLLLDLRILARTIPAVLRGVGAS